MGATLRQSEPDFEQTGNTEQLFNWITTVRTKKIKYLRSRRRNIRVEAVLGYALTQAQQELRNKQIERINRWQELQLQKMKSKNGESGEKESNMDDQACANNGAKAWEGNLHPELSSLDAFMSSLSQIKVPLQR